MWDLAQRRHTQDELWAALDSSYKKHPPVKDCICLMRGLLSKGILSLGQTTHPWLSFYHTLLTHLQKLFHKHTKLKPKSLKGSSCSLDHGTIQNEQRAQVSTQSSDGTHLCLRLNLTFLYANATSHVLTPVMTKKRSENTSISIIWTRQYSPGQTNRVQSCEAN